MGRDDPTSFTIHELRAVRGRYRVVVDAGPGFRTTALKINGAHAGVFQPFPKTGCEDEAELKLIAEEEVEDEASIIVLGEELWKPGETRAFIEAVVQFFPARRCSPWKSWRPRALTAAPSTWCCSWTRQVPWGRTWRRRRRR